MKALYRSRRLSRWALLIFVAGSAYACEDFLAANPQGSLDEGTLANRHGVEGNLIATYRMLDHAGWGATGSAASNWVWGSVTSDDAHKGSEASDQPAITDIEMYVWGTGAAEDYLNDRWRHSFEAIVRANATIKLLNKVDSLYPDEISQADKDGIRGEALFLRAHYYFEAWRIFGSLPYLTEEDTTFYKSNVGVDVVGNILSDLDEAITLLAASSAARGESEATPRNGEVGRATAWTARAYKGKVQVYAEEYSAAVTTLENVRDNGPYDLEPNFYQVWSGFSEYQNGAETILAYQAHLGEPSGYNANYGEHLNFPHSGSPFGCCGFHQPTQNLVNFFAVDADGLPMALTDPAWNDREDNLDATASATMRLDPRLDWTVGRDGVPYKDWGHHEPSWIRSAAFGGPYSPKKNIFEDASAAAVHTGWCSSTHLSSMNMHIFRYADMLLLLAEAYVEEGRLEDARAIVNEIRARAGQAAQGCALPPDEGRATTLVTLYPQCAGDARIAVPLDDPSIAWADYEVGLYPAAGWDQSFATEAVRYERRLELAMEGERFFDLRRWRTAEQVLNDYIAAEQVRRPYLAASATFSARHALFPIPAIQIELSRLADLETGAQKDVLVQNPGW
ncbi:MAG: RagB/SusD family nutrient uptake outer membrane protein [Gemmatimonadota bacterium]|nr:MAG: RagB/SusD family nutrient uptake outer membrane protein [Gemmatimonadota bacterium]